MSPAGCSTGTAVQSVAAFPGGAGGGRLRVVRAATVGDACAPHAAATSNTAIEARARRPARDLDVSQLPQAVGVTMSTANHASA